jgi:hypothetical protein
MVLLLMLYTRIDPKAQAAEENDYKNVLQCILMCTHRRKTPKRKQQKRVLQYILYTRIGVRPPSASSRRGRRAPCLASCSSQETHGNTVVTLLSQCCFVLLHCYYTLVTLLLHCLAYCSFRETHGNTVVTLLSHSCLLHCCYTAVQCCYTVWLYALFMRHTVTTNTITVTPL